MGKKNDLSYYTQLNYDIIIRKQGDLYFLLIPELNLIVESDNLSDAYERMGKKKEQLFSDMIDAKAYDVINEPKPTLIRKNFFAELPVFCIKIFLVFFICTSLLCVIFIGTLPLANSLVSNIPRRVLASTYALAGKVNTKFSNLTDEQKQELRMQYRRLLHEVKPFIDDTKTVLIEKIDDKMDSIAPSEK